LLLRLILRAIRPLYCRYAVDALSASRHSKLEKELRCAEPFPLALCTGGGVVVGSDDATAAEKQEEKKLATRVAVTLLGGPQRMLALLNGKARLDDVGHIVLQVSSK